MCFCGDGVLGDDPFSTNSNPAVLLLFFGTDNPCWHLPQELFQSTVFVVCLRPRVLHEMVAPGSRVCATARGDDGVEDLSYNFSLS